MKKFILYILAVLIIFPQSALAGTILSPSSGDFSSFRIESNGTASGTVSGQGFSYTYWTDNGNMRWYKSSSVAIGTGGQKYYSTIGVPIPQVAPSHDTNVSAAVTLISEDNGEAVWSFSTIQTTVVGGTPSTGGGTGGGGTGGGGTGGGGTGGGGTGGGGTGGGGAASGPVDANADQMNGVITFLLKLILVAAAGMVPVMLGDKLAKAISGKINDLSSNAKKSQYARSRWGSDRAVKRKAAENLAQGRAWGRMQKGAQMQANAMQKMGLDKYGWGRNAIGNAQMRAGIAGTAAEKMNEEAYSKMHGAAAKRLADAEMEKPAMMRDLNKIEAGARRLIELDEITGEDLGKYAQALAGADGLDSTNRAFSLIQGAEKRRPGVANHHEVAKVLDKSMLDPRASHDDERVKFLEDRGFLKQLENLHPQIESAYSGWKSAAKAQEGVETAFKQGRATQAQVSAAKHATRTAKQGYETLMAQAEQIRNSDGARGAFTAMGRAYRVNEEKAVQQYQDQYGQGEEAWTKDQKGVIRISTGAASQMNSLQLQQAFNGWKPKSPAEAAKKVPYDAYEAAKRVLVHGGSIEQARQEALRVGSLAATEWEKSGVEYNNFGAWNEGTQVAFVQALSQQLGVEIRPDQRGGNPPNQLLGADGQPIHRENRDQNNQGEGGQRAA